MPSRPTAGARGSTPVLRGWRPGPAARLAVLGGVIGSFVGLVLGLSSPDRPFAGSLLLYLLGFLAGVVIGTATGLGVQALRATRERPGP